MLVVPKNKSKFMCSMSLASMYLLPLCQVSQGSQGSQGSHVFESKKCSVGFVDAKEAVENSSSNLILGEESGAKKNDADKNKKNSVLFLVEERGAKKTDTNGDDSNASVCA